MTWLRALYCKWTSHVWRKARKKEDQAKRFCSRCGASAAIKKRTKETT